MAVSAAEIIWEITISQNAKPKVDYVEIIQNKTAGLLSKPGCCN
jgi:hypothetical protein